jgi:hypothetical protein
MAKNSDDARERRLAEALRENLRRRKGQAREREATDVGLPGPASDPS